MRPRKPTRRPYGIPLTNKSETLDLVIAGQRKIYNFECLRHWRKRYVLHDGECVMRSVRPDCALAPGSMNPGVSVGATLQLTGIWLGCQDANGSNLAVGPWRQIESERDVNVETCARDIGGAPWALRNQQLSLLCTTAANAGLNAGNEFVVFEGWFAEQPTSM